LSIIGCSMAIAADVLILLITWAKTADIWKARNENPASFNLVDRLLRNGTSYFCALLCMHITTLVLNLLVKVPQFSYVCVGASNILIARFMLDLRGITNIRDYSAPGGVTVSSIKFVGNVVDMDSPTWTKNASDEDDPEDDIRPPFRVNDAFQEDVV